ncbi:MAG: site-specific DNA-methyltransferase [Flavobacteriaceae bacterium]|nr:site-specific DNA-methyltransferase [Flavobacteriaceae bacterium]
MITGEVYSDNRIRLFHNDVLKILDDLPENEIQAVVTSPTYWGKRQFTDDQNEFGCESLENYVERNVLLYSTLLSKMKQGGSIFVVIQDSYMGSGVSRSHHNHWISGDDYKRNGIDSSRQGNTSSVTARHKKIKNKSLCGVPYRIALKLVDMGFVWRQQIIWQKPNPMPENVQDRAWQSVEYILHFTNHGKYKFNKELFSVSGANGKLRLPSQVLVSASEPKPGHSATFPKKVVERLLLTVTDENDVVFEPFLGSGTMLELAIKHNRKFIGCDICKDFLVHAIDIIKKDSVHLSVPA